MQDTALDAYLGGTSATDEQRTALSDALDAVTARYPEQGDDDATTAGSAAAEVILGDDTIESIAAIYLAARHAERAAMAALTGAIIASDTLGTSESEIARVAGVNRMTVRKALGK